MVDRLSVTYFTDMAAAGKKTQNLLTYSICRVLMASLTLPIKVLTTLVTAIIDTPRSLDAGILHSSTKLAQPGLPQVE